jgi:CDP-diacylglycerol--glycerol-3-phosphate 3-phosphatidyltransferase
VFESSLARIIIIVLIVLGLLSDIFDGVIARKYNVATDRIRKLDSNVDILFTVSILTGIFILNNKIIEYLPEIIFIISLELVTYLAYWIRFKKQPSNHSYLTKVFGVVLFFNFCMIIGWNNFEFLKLLMIISTISYIDGFAILFRLKHWKTDNKSVFHLNKKVHI